MRILIALLLCALAVGCGDPRPLESAGDGTVRFTFTADQIQSVGLTDYYLKDPKPVEPARHQEFYDAVNGAKEIAMGARLAFEPDKAVLFTLTDGRKVVFYGGSEGGRNWGVNWGEGGLKMMVDSKALGDARRGSGR